MGNLRYLVLLNIHLVASAESEAAFLRIRSAFSFPNVLLGHFEMTSEACRALKKETPQGEVGVCGRDDKLHPCGARECDEPLRKCRQNPGTSSSYHNHYTTTSISLHLSQTVSLRGKTTTILISSTASWICISRRHIPPSIASHAHTSASLHELANVFSEGSIVSITRSKLRRGSFKSLH